jgi:hypothetical protein
MKEKYLKLINNIIVITKNNIEENTKRDYHCEFKVSFLNVFI